MIFMVVFVMTLLFNMIRALRTCPTEKDHPRSWGFLGGLKLGLFSAIFATLMYIIVGLFSVLVVPFIAISILPYATTIGEGFYVALGGFLGYWFGRLFIDLC
jgi:hypothetical protein